MDNYQLSNQRLALLRFMPAPNTPELNRIGIKGDHDLLTGTDFH